MKPSMAGPGTPVSIIRRKEAMPIFLTKDKLTPVKAWDTTGRLDDMERMFNQLKGDIVKANDSKSVIEESLELYKTRAQELTTENREMNSQMRSLSSELERVRSELHTTSTDLRQMRRDHERESLDMERKYEREIADLRSKHEREQSRFEREREKEADRFRRELEEAKKAWEKEKDRESTEVIAEHWDEMDQLRKVHEAEKSKMQKELDGLRKAQESRATESASEVQLMKEQNASLKNQLEASRAMEISLKGRISTYESRITALEQEKTTLLSKTHFLEGNQEAQSQEFTDMAARLQEAIAERDATVETLRKEERLRRKLNATILELRGNIRVFVRTRPLLNGENDPAKVEYLEEDSLDGCKEMVVHAPTSQSVTGKVRNEKHNYGFDRVFTPGTPNDDVFEECRDLIQSVVDGYNVSILSYGQTGSGKTYGMTGPQGIIPSAIHMLLSEMQRLKDKGWEYAVEANFVEVYNETLNDLLGDAKAWDDADDMGASVRGKKKEKHEIHHDAATGKTTVTNLTTVGLWPPQTDDGHWPPTAPTEGAGSVGSPAATSYTEKAVNHLLDTAAKNRRVAATKANERSSRSHSIFILTLKGSCAATNETSEGILNLVDLAGSERLKQSGAEGSRMKETQAINKSLSSLGDVIAALGNKSGNSEAHVPYRNSKVCAHA
jgi:kinesin family protein C1